MARNSREIEELGMANYEAHFADSCPHYGINVPISLKLFQVHGFPRFLIIAHLPGMVCENLNYIPQEITVHLGENKQEKIKDVCT